MRVAAYELDSSREAHRYIQHGQVLAMALRPGSIEVGLRRSEMTRSTYDTGEMILPRRRVEEWVRTDDIHLLVLEISDTPLMAACDGTNAEVELRYEPTLVDTRVGALVAAVNAKDLRGFRPAACFWIPSSRRLPLRWSKGMQYGHARCPSIEGG
jgi:hypothetical protein